MSDDVDRRVQLRGPNFIGDDGKLYLVRCYACDGDVGRENYGPMVASGTCAWCGWRDPAVIAAAESRRLG